MIEQSPIVVLMPMFHPDVKWVALGCIAAVIAAFYVHAKWFFW